VKSLYDFIIKPLNERYDNEKKVGDKTLIINTKIESYKSVSNTGVVIAVPIAFSTNIKVGDQVTIHHNVFRRFYDVRGVEKNSRSYFKDNMYFCNVDQIYLYKKDGGEWESFMDRCFIKPIKNRSSLGLDKEEPHIGIIKYDNKSLNDLGITNGMLITFKPNSEFEFVIEGERLYCMKSNDIVVKHEYKGDEEEYNPSWA
jgi:uncharacterized protein YneR